MKIFIINSQGLNCEVTVNSNDTVESLKKEICEAIGVEVKKQRLIFNAKELTDDAKTLHDYGIVENSRITMEIRFYITIMFGEKFYPMEFEPGKTTIRELTQRFEREVVQPEKLGHHIGKTREDSPYKKVADDVILTQYHDGKFICSNKDKTLTYNGSQKPDEKVKEHHEDKTQEKPSSTSNQALLINVEVGAFAGLCGSLVGYAWNAHSTSGISSIFQEASPKICIAATVIGGAVGAGLHYYNASGRSV